MKIVSGTTYVGALAFAAVIGAAFMVAAVGSSPGASAQLPAIPQTLNGTTSDSTVDGEPYDGTSPIEVLDQDGAVLGTADVANGVWVFRVNEGASETVIRIGLEVTDPIPFAQGALTTVIITAVTPPLAVTTTVSLSAGFQSQIHTGGALTIDDFLALFSSSEAVSGVFVWDRSVGNWASWRRGLPGPLQGVTQIGENTALLLSLDSAVTYESEVVGHEAGTHALDAVFTAVPFNGPEGTSIADGDRRHHRRRRCQRDLPLQQRHRRLRLVPRGVATDAQLPHGVQPR